MADHHQPDRLNIRHLEKERRRLSLIQFPFYSAIGCLVPFLTAHMNDIGLTASESALINAAGGLATLAGALIFGPLTHRYRKYTLMISVMLLLSTLTFTALLFVPRVIRTPKHAQIVFDCTNGNLLVEKCQNWHSNCDVHAKRLASGNFTNFSLYQCRYVCGPNSTISPIPKSPIQVCFESSSEGTTCMDSMDSFFKPLPTSTTLSPSMDIPPMSSEFSPIPDHKPLEPIQFDSRFDRWPLLDIRTNIFGTGGTTPFCSFRSNEAIIIKSQTYQSINCRPAQPACTTQCKVDMVHRAHSVLTSPLPCYRVSGDSVITFWSYLAARCVADFCLFTGFALMDALSITLTNDFDSIYGRISKTIAISFPMIGWPAGVGALVDYFSIITQRPDYSPVFVIYNGLILITIIMLVCFPVRPLINMDTDPLVSYTSLSQTSLTAIGSSSNSISRHGTGGNNTVSNGHKSSTSKISSRNHLPSLLDDGPPKMSLKNKFIFTSLLPFILLLASFWGLLFTWLSAYYLEQGISKLWLGLGTSMAFASFAPFALVIKPLTDGIGRVHLIVLGFVFYAIRLSGISFLHQPRWTLIPFQCMEAFTLPLAWIGITSTMHRLIPSNNSSTHLWTHFMLIILHFGVGRMTGAVGWFFWLQDWEENNNRWDWLIYDWPLIKIAANYDLSSYRLLLRLCAIIAAVSAIVVLFCYHLCCRYPRRRRFSEFSSRSLSPDSEAWKKNESKKNGGNKVADETNSALLNGNRMKMGDNSEDSDYSSEKKKSERKKKKKKKRNDL